MKKKTILMDEEQLITKAMEALIEKLGLMETIRFLSLKSQETTRLDSVTRHRQWQAQLDKEAFLKEIFKHQEFKA